MSTTNNGRTSDSGARILRVLMALRGHYFFGITNGELAKTLGEAPSTINRCLNTLIEAGLAEQKDNGRFCHSIGMLQIAQSHANDAKRLEAKIAESNQRIYAGSIN